MKYIARIVSTERKPYYLGLDDMDFLPVDKKKDACRFDNMEQINLELDLWLNQQEVAEIIEVKK